MDSDALDQNVGREPTSLAEYIEAAREAGAIPTEDPWDDATEAARLSPDGPNQVCPEPHCRYGGNPFGASHCANCGERLPEDGMVEAELVDLP